MNAPCVAVADPDSQHSQPRACEPLAERTVYLRRQAQGWVVSIDEALVLSTINEDEAFHFASDARWAGGGEPLRLLILSGPSAAAYAWPAVDPNGFHGALKPALACATVHHDCGGGSSPSHAAEVAA